MQSQDRAPGRLEWKIRRARMSDKEPLMSFIKAVWGGHDYIPEVWDKWIADRSGKMFVVEVGGRPVGMNRVRFLDDGSAWFEGVRVHPRFRGMGLATELGKNSMKVARAHGARTFRLTSGSRNHQAHRQVARMNFVEKTRFSVYSPPDDATYRSSARIRRARPSDFKEMVGTIRKSRESRIGGVSWEGFTAVGLTDGVIRKRVNEGSVYQYGEAVAIAKPGGEGKEVWNQVCFICGPEGDAVRLVKEIFSRGRSDWRLVTVPQGSPLVGALRRGGLKRSFSMILFQGSANG